MTNITNDDTILNAATITISNKIKNITFDNVDLTESEIIKTSLNNVDLSNCNIFNIKFDMYSLKGIIIDRFQCENIVGILGVQIKDR